MKLDEDSRSCVAHELALLDHRLRTVQRDAMAATAAIGGIVALLAVLGGWAVV